MLDKEYTDVIMEKLKKYGKVKVSMLSEREVKYVLADLISRGYKVRYEDGFFVFEGFQDQ